jgi:Tol biopolymer transport system component
LFANHLSEAVEKPKRERGMKNVRQGRLARAFACATAIAVVACGGHVSLGGDSGTSGAAGMAWQGCPSGSCGGSYGDVPSGYPHAGNGDYAIGGAYPALPACKSIYDDDTWIAFDSDRQDLDRELYLVRPDGSELTRLTNRPGVDQEPSVSPDGKQLAFTSDRDGSLQIYLLDWTSGDVTALTHRAEGANQASFSHDGKLVAFHSGSSTYTISLDGEDERLVATESDGLGPSEWPRFSQDDTHLVFDRSTRIDVTALDGSASRMIVQNWATTIQSPALSANGINVAYQVACDSGPALSIWSAPYTSNTEPCAGARITPPGEPQSEHPSWGPADRIAYARVDVVQNVGQIAIISRERGRTPCALTTDYSDNRNPFWYVPPP